MKNLRRNVIIMTLLLCLSVVFYGCNSENENLNEMPKQGEKPEMRREMLDEEGNPIERPERKEMLDENGNPIERIEKEEKPIEHGLPVERPVLVEK